MNSKILYMVAKNHTVLIYQDLDIQAVRAKTCMLLLRMSRECKSGPRPLSLFIGRLTMNPGPRASRQAAVLF